MFTVQEDEKISKVIDELSTKELNMRNIHVDEIENILRIQLPEYKVIKIYGDTLCGLREDSEDLVRKLVENIDIGRINPNKLPVVWCKNTLQLFIADDSYEDYTWAYVYIEK